jgi:hypothetical protein
VDETDLIEALRNGVIAGAALRRFLHRASAGGASAARYGQRGGLRRTWPGIRASHHLLQEEHGARGSGLF